MNLNNSTIAVKDCFQRIEFKDTLPFLYHENIHENELLDLNNASQIDILNNLKNRLLTFHCTCTNLGPILLMINPYEKEEVFYSQNSINRIIKNKNSNFNIKEPHLFEIVIQSIKQLLNNKSNQFILFSGESGAGKTEATKNSLQCIFYYFNGNNNKEQNLLLQNQINCCNGLLDAFGNAKTIQNNNSSRFSKCLSVIINIHTEKIEGIMIKTMLLEKSRVCEVLDGERSFHIFYQLISCGDQELLSSLYLTNDITQYDILIKSNCYEIEGVNDKEAFKQTLIYLSDNGFSKEEIDNILKILASILLLGNLSFRQEKNKEIVINNKDTLEHIGELLQSKDEDIEKAFTVNINKISGVEYSKSVKDITDARTLCNVFSQDLYNKLFHYIEMKINTQFNPNEYSILNLNSKTESNFLTLIDIFGFENQKNNSLEQLCINYTNEVLEQYFLKSYYNNEINDFSTNGLTELGETIIYSTNQEIIDIFDSDQKSLFSFIKESTFNAQNNIKFFDNLQKNIGKLHKLVQFPRNANKGSFQIIHGAQPVLYNSSLMLFKNKDEVKNSLIEIIEKSKNIKLQQIFLMNDTLNKELLQNEFDEIKKLDYQKKNKMYLIDKYLEQLKGLLKNLSESNTHYIRCLIPNLIKKSFHINESYLLNQIKYFSISEIIKYKSEGYSIRWIYYDFFKHFDLIFYDSQANNSYLDSDYKTLSIKIIQILTPEYSIPQDPPLYVYGTNRVFLKAHYMNLLEMRMENKLKNKINGLHILKVGIIYIKMKKKRNNYCNNIRAIQVFYKTNSSHTKIQGKIRNINLIKTTFLTKQLKTNFSVLLHHYQILQSYLKSDVVCYQIEQKRKVIKILAYKLHIYMKLIAQKRRKKMKQIATELISKAINVIRVGEYYILWKKINPFFISFIIKKKYAGIAIKAKKEKYKEKKLYMLIVFQSHNFFYRIQQKSKGSKLIRLFVITNISLNYFESLKNNIMIIQEYFKKYYLKKITINHQIKKCFNEDEEVNQNKIISSQKILFPNSIVTIQHHQQQLFQSNESNIHSFPSISYYDIILNSSLMKNKINYIAREQINKEINADLIPEMTLYNENKIKLFSHLFDIDIMTDLSEVYDNLWAEEYRKVNKLNMDKKTPLQMIYTSESNTFALNSKGKMYSWGWNNYGQCWSNINDSTKNGILPLFKFKDNNCFPLPLVNYKTSTVPVLEKKEIGKINHIACGIDYTFILNDQNRVFCLGLNNTGQLGLGHCDLVMNPQILSSLDGNVKDIKTTENMTVILTNEGELYMWYTLKYNEANLPSLIYRNSQNTITQLSCGCNFIMLLAHNGIVFGMGSNACGELGLEGREMRIKPEEIETLSHYKDKIISVRCGYKHTICLSSTGRVYSWGVNSSGQLGKEDQVNNQIPQIVHINTKNGNCPIKAVHIAAGFRSSFFLMENKKIYYCGIIESREIIVYRPIQFKFELKVLFLFNL